MPTSHHRSLENFNEGESFSSAESEIYELISGAYEFIRASHELRKTMPKSGNMEMFTLSQKFDRLGKFFQRASELKNFSDQEKQDIFVTIAQHISDEEFTNEDRARLAGYIMRFEADEEKTDVYH